MERSIRDTWKLLNKTNIHIWSIWNRGERGEKAVCEEILSEQYSNMTKDINRCRLKTV